MGGAHVPVKEGEARTLPHADEELVPVITETHEKLVSGNEIAA